jgi:predicted MFS family arabinose efflux permease
LPSLSASLRASSVTVGLCVTSNQAGYAAGLVLLVPLGDLVDRRRLIVSMLAVNVLALTAAALAPDITALAVALALVGVSGSAINVLIPAAASLVRADHQGRVVGMLMTGLLLGVLLARTAAGTLDRLAGWRLVYGLAAIGVAVVAVALRSRLPALPANAEGSYRRLLGSVARLIVTEPLLRRRMALGAVGFASFQLLWTALPFMLASPPYRYSPPEIGLFGLLGAAGAVCAQFAGRLNDRGHAHRGTAALLVVLAAGWLACGQNRHLATVIVGILLLDVGIQGMHVLNQARIYGLGSRARSRLTTAYMTAYFLGGAVGSAAAVSVYICAGWTALCGVGLGFAALALIVWIRDGATVARTPEAPAPVLSPPSAENQTRSY